ncbi:MAG: hypothetical protein SFT94_06560 [Pseudanabaenaceae cyanobacterium bins.68]|nr:hypothetical protein [Pseudanabaenaceae cyanobacterium bins.68]
MDQLLKQLGLDALPTPESIAAAVAQTAINTLISPEIHQAVGDLLAPTALTVAQDVLKACDHGKISHDAALKIVAIALADDQERRLKPIN